MKFLPLLIYFFFFNDSKGASVIRMIAEYVGEAAMRKGLNNYLNEHKYKNAVTQVS